ncbi:hypothetical protein H6P81_003111 [Aristolochia fimbriata]|uniref:Uncharacterized protein n=1 Tax=Aristolochia fimbriata TaxID=158543 RepID=A0AAV7FBV6_ARIFI|nr:hypothetical protein H6P81_003111 [Aristolochia fimbriata]
MILGTAAAFHACPEADLFKLGRLRERFQIETRHGYIWVWTVGYVGCGPLPGTRWCVMSGRNWERPKMESAIESHVGQTPNDVYVGILVQAVISPPGWDAEPTDNRREWRLVGGPCQGCVVPPKAPDAML